MSEEVKHIALVGFIPGTLPELREALASSQAEIARYRQALEIIAGVRPCPDNLMGNVDIAKAALSDTRSDG